MEGDPPRSDLSADVLEHLDPLLLLLLSSLGLGTLRRLRGGDRSRGRERAEIMGEIMGEIMEDRT